MGRRRENLSSLPLAAQRFRQRQDALLDRTYDEAWTAGRDSYTPDPDPQQSSSPGQLVASASTGAAGILIARRARSYVAPTTPDQAAKAQALAPALDSARRMSIELSAVTPDDDQLEQARQEAAAGRIDTSDVAAHATALAAAAWVGVNAWRLNAGESVAWAGEQHGYAQAATADGMQLEWQTEDDESVCEDCLDLGDLPPMPLEEWPTMPGEGATQCDVGCRCSLVESDLIELAQLDLDQQQVVDDIAFARLEALNS